MTAATRPVRAAIFASVSAASADERRAQQEVLGRVAGDRELGERDEVDVGGLGRRVGVEDARRVALEVADDEIELGGGDAEPGHGPRIRPRRRTGPAAHRASSPRATLRACSIPSPCSPRPGWRRRWNGRPTRPSPGLMLARVLEAHPGLAETIRDQPARARRAHRDRVRLALADRPRSSTTRPSSNPSRRRCLRPPSATPTSTARLLASDGVADPGALRRWKRRELLRIAARDLLGRADLPTRRARARRARRGVPRGRARDRGAGGADRGDRHGQARRLRAQLLVRRRRALRARGPDRRGRAERSAGCCRSWPNRPPTASCSAPTPTSDPRAARARSHAPLDGYDARSGSGGRRPGSSRRC